MGNEGSRLEQYGTNLENNITVTWEKTEGTELISPREGHCAAACHNKLFIFGGVTKRLNGEPEELNDMKMFDAEKKIWSNIDVKGDIPAPRAAATMAAVGDKLYMFGGLSQSCGWFNDVHMFNTEDNTWSVVKAEGVGYSPRDKLGSAVIDKRIYLFGGFGPQGSEEEVEEVEEFDEGDEEVVEALEESQDGAQFGWFNDLLVFDTTTCSWSQPMQMNLGVPTPRAAHAMCSVDKYLVIFGGKDAEARKNDIHIFDTETRKWATDLKTTGRQPEPRSFHTVTTMGTRVVVTGGRGVSNQHFADFHIFDTNSKQWLQPEIQGDKPEGRGMHTATTVGEYFIVFGGSSNFNQDTMQCNCLHGDSFIVKKDDILAQSSKKVVEKQETSKEGMSSEESYEPSPKKMKSEGEQSSGDSGTSG